MINLASDKRNALSASSMIWVVMTAANLGTDDAKQAAAALIEKIFVKDLSDQIHKELAASHAEARLHSIGTSIAGAQALRQGMGPDPRSEEKLAPTHGPHDLEGQVLTEWAAADPSKYTEAIGAWNRLREMLERHGSLAGPGKVEPKYKVIYSEAECFYRLAQKNQNKDEGKGYAKTGLDLLLPYITLDPVIRTPRRGVQGGRAAGTSSSAASWPIISACPSPFGPGPCTRPGEGPKHQRSPSPSAAVSACIRLEQGQIAVVDFQGQAREAGLHDATAMPAPGVLLRRPASVGALIGIADLGVDQQIAHLAVPGVPLVSAHVVHDLGRIIPVVDVGERLRRASGSSDRPCRR